MAKSKLAGVKDPDTLVSLMSEGHRYEGDLLTRSETWLNERADKLKEEYDGDGWEDSGLDDQFKTIAIKCIYGGVNPKDVPNRYIKHAVTNPVSGTFPHMKSRGRVKNVNTGIRAFCIDCQGGDTPSVRNCPSFNCPLYPFRMGKNPFYGKFSEDAASDADIAKELNDAN